MIALPDTYINQLYVDTKRLSVIFHFKNSADEYFTHTVYLDKAYPFQTHMTNLEQFNGSTLQAYRLTDALEMQFTEPSDQDWHPAPLPGDGIMSLQQYSAHLKVQSMEDRHSA